MKCERNISFSFTRKPVMDDKRWSYGQVSRWGHTRGWNKVSLNLTPQRSPSQLSYKYLTCHKVWRMKKFLQIIVSVIRTNSMISSRNDSKRMPIWTRRGIYLFSERMNKRLDDNPLTVTLIPCTPKQGHTN